jgi:hypothetical protein
VNHNAATGATVPTGETISFFSPHSGLSDRGEKKKETETLVAFDDSALFHAGQGLGAAE